ncbi:hypothetical protein [Rhodococcus sp. X156]|uniref:hypothetical protein n=1 Tax=Rhodococcus sp. X156 TaxID=2499145 RepID=UPI000FDC257B|nr:hypothetical protein [Rhodococcus sp. X156]
MPTASEDTVVAALVAAGPALDPSRAARSRMQRRLLAALRTADRTGADRTASESLRLAVSH